MKSFYVYIMASGRNGTLYAGSASDLIKQVWEHKNSVIPGFTAKYNVHMLVYYEVHATYVEAARREKRLKNWRQQWKLNLIETINPNGMIYMKIFAVDWDHLDAADKPRHVGGGDEL